MNIITIVLTCGIAITLSSKINRETDIPEQVQSDTVYFDKGRTLNFLIGIVKSEAMEARGNYFNAVFPIASKYQYDLGVAFNVIEPTRGNYHPGFVAISSWPNPANRDKFLKDPGIPKDLADQRRAIWSRFDQVLYRDIESALSFVVREDKVYLFSNFWIEDQRLFEKYMGIFQGEMENNQGVYLASLEGGSSPKNHMYEPDLMVISEWPNPEAVKNYLLKIQRISPQDGTKNINEFVTSFVFGFGS
ncbi:MAG: hypothetical protein DHS20C17_28170 [Cyclobacteriaceae bacterium]|nr:MAG: hypothetical protein DHS20C17_28170 [Cyclobacteriaceae bacterium]